MTLNKKSPDDVAKDIMQKHIFKTMTDTEELYVCEDGVYNPRAEIIVKAETEKILGADTTTHKVNEVIGHIKRKTHHERKNTNPKRYINLKNGFFDLEENKLIPHDPKIVSTSQIPVMYNPTKDCPAIKKFLSDVLPEKFIPLIEEFIGYTLMDSYRFHKALMLEGNGRNGKSTLTNLHRKFLGTSNVTSNSLQELSHDRFSTAELCDKKANICSELSSGELADTRNFKTLTGGEDIVHAQRKFQHPFDFVNTAKLIFATNQIPEAHDVSDAFYRRWIIIRFPNKFDGAAADKNLLDKLTTDDELSGLLNLALNGLNRLLQQGHFTNEPTIEETKLLYQIKSSSVCEFLHEKTQEDPTSITIKQELYEKYETFCINKGIPPLDDNVFGKRIKQYKPHLVEQRHQTKPAWKGINVL